MSAAVRTRTITSDRRLTADEYDSPKTCGDGWLRERGAAVKEIYLSRLGLGGSTEGKRQRLELQGTRFA